ncbi:MULTISPECIES: aminoacyl-tRNA hydrolase [unclassified Mesotoga]|uniref:aminoacyl-tRNA hydrolase n=1 Tax=unclassified Mesotoga TaxID=1184398 RepID=UPI000EF29189|nr:MULTISPECIES: aminoacyl-tRNA hydrolase [unclassified Mesotoga]MDI9367768.1 aminoacyl-tRNA hydrolase [Thermotogota bacterium]MDD4207551.1 aminoacyl-tRNA hydrolase [Mesotoga sp.]MDD4825882.1 aminoacyl-tRNA hydrolase [Mesotoga sp.]MDD5682707.1 aminoacyl-tRNA hydrolase [Mesotoga sp.]RLL86511.1 peptidyl-tRNA hydrolase [Mesotoga sp. BH458_6_3_2_1]
MFLFVGLGNPGPRYALTRHNVGFLFVDEMIKLGLRKTIQKRIYEAYLLEGEEKLYVAKPLTFMNLSGVAVRMMLKDLNFSDGDTLVLVYDDVWIPLGRIRIRESGSDGGHNGLKSVISEIGTKDFPRIRIGVGPLPEYGDMVDYVLGKFSNDEYERVSRAIDLSVTAAKELVIGDIRKVMSIYNGIETIDS